MYRNQVLSRGAPYMYIYIRQVPLNKWGLAKILPVGGVPENKPAPVRANWSAP